MCACVCAASRVSLTNPSPRPRLGLLVYIACMVELSLSTELFYLGHELSNSYPKQASSWYCVGCYYWSCRKLELAQKYLQKVGPQPCPCNSL